MAFAIFALSLILLLAGLWSGYASLDLLPTPLGVLYALAGAIAASMAVLAFALGVAIRRIDALAALMRRPAAHLSGAAAAIREPTLVAPAMAQEIAAEALPVEALAVEAAVPETAGQGASAHEGAAPPLEAEAAGALEEAAEHPRNENRAGHLPTLGHAPEPELEPESQEARDEPPAMVGRYSSGGANYMIFSDGSIEAETTEGTFKFPSMGDFKRFIAERKEGEGVRL